MAISALQAALDYYGSPVYVYHEIVHNTWVVENFKKQGAIFISNLNEVPEGSCIMYSAHGVSPEVDHEAHRLNLKVVDATCPLVKRIHKQAKEYAHEGLHIILVGHAGHDEILGILGEAPDLIHVVGCVEDVYLLDIHSDTPVAYLTQTTLSTQKADEIISSLKERFPHIRAPLSGCICFATQNRQRAVKELTPLSDVVLVVGSRSSSNSLRLLEIAQSVFHERKKDSQAFLVDGVSELKRTWFQDDHTVLLTAGASAPEWVVQQIISQLQEWFSAEVQTEIICEESLSFQLPPIHNP